MGVADFKSVSHHRWDRIPEESLKGTITRRLVTGERMMIAHVYLKKGDDVPRHSHENEQLTYILEGALKFWIGEDGAEEITVSAGEVLLIPSQVPHCDERRATIPNGSSRSCATVLAFRAWPLRNPAAKRTHTR